MNLPKDRLYIQITPTDESRKRLEDIANELRNTVKGIAVDPGKWHVTILHIGVANHVFYDIKREYPALSEKIFQDALDSYVNKTREYLPGRMSLKPAGFELIGIRENVLVLTFETSDELIAAHELAVQNLHKFLTDCKVQDPENFMKGSVNFRWALDFVPHLTLYRAVNSEVPKMKLPDLLDFEPGSVHGL